MKQIYAEQLDFAALNREVREGPEEILLTGCLGQRFIAAGMERKKITVEGIPGNALGAYLNGASVTVKGNAQDAVGDTMNAGSIVIHGNAGDAVGYAMRGGEIYIRGDAGYRAGIHMKAYREKQPVMVIGGRTGSFLGEYQAGGLILVLGLHTDGKPTVGNFPCTGMHGGKLVIRGDISGILFPEQVTARSATEQDMEELLPYIRHYSELFGTNPEDLLAVPFSVITPDSKNPYKQMYVAN